MEWDTVTWDRVERGGKRLAMVYDTMAKALRLFCESAGRPQVVWVMARTDADAEQIVQAVREVQAHICGMLLLTEDFADVRTKVVG